MQSNKKFIIFAENNQKMKKVLIIGVGSKYENIYFHNKHISSDPPKSIQNDTSTHNENFDVLKIDMQFIPNNKIRSKYKRKLKYR